MLDTIETKAAGGESLPAAPAVRPVGVAALPKTPVDSIAVCGSNPATIGAAPFGQANWAIHACSPDNTPYGHSKNCRELPRVTEWHELHDIVCDETRPFEYAYHIATTMPIVWLRNKRTFESGFFKGGRLYPERELKGTSTLQEIKVPTGAFRQAKNQNGEIGFVEVMEKRVVEVPNHDGIFDPCQFTSSIAYMLAKAIFVCEDQGIRQIGLWGIMQQSQSEWTYQRPGIQYFLHQAMKHGIQVVANRESCLFDMPNWKW